MYATFQKEVPVGADVWRKKKNKLDPQQYLFLDYKKFKSGKVKVFVYNCHFPGCDKLIYIRQSHLRYSTGRCKKHAYNGKPFEAAYGGLKRNAKDRRLQFNLTYRDYLNFAKIDNCHYCNDYIPWKPYNQHGKNNPAYFLDRLDSSKGYTKENCVVCCTTCNMAKRSMTKDNFIEMCKKICFNFGTCGS